jgi:hypothetical protein
MTILLNMTKGMHTDRDLATAKNVQFGNNLANKFSRHIENAASAFFQQHSRHKKKTSQSANRHDRRQNKAYPCRRSPRSNSSTLCHFSIIQLRTLYRGNLAKVGNEFLRKTCVLLRTSTNLRTVGGQ